MRLRAPVSRSREMVALALALCSLSLGLVPWGRLLPVAPGVVSNPLALAAFAKTLWPLLGGVVLALLLGRWGHPLPHMVTSLGEARRAALGVAGLVERTDGLLRESPSAGLSLLALAILF
jgi:multicomponent Na+:H+ antiporter subunit D